MKFRKFLQSVLFGGVSEKISCHIKLAKKCKKFGCIKLGRFLHLRMQRYGVYISEKAEIADSVKFPHPIGVVIGEGVVIGKNVKIFQNVTIGGARIGDVRAGRYPTVSDGVVIFAGAVIVGEITIGENSIIGANAVVVRNVPPFSTCVGVPGRVTPRKC